MVEFSFFTNEVNKWKKAAESCEIIRKPLEIKEYDKAIILPLKWKDPYKGLFMGGVCTEDYNFIAGCSRKIDNSDGNRTCLYGYVPEETIEISEETVVFCGALMTHFGHILVDGFSRMWWYAKNINTKYKLVFLNMEPDHSVFEQYFDLIGLTKERYLVIDKPMQFKKVIVPDEAMYSLTAAAHPDWLLFVDLIKSRIKEKLSPPTSEYEKLYLTRRQLKTGCDVGEEFYEEYYNKCGYKIVALETFPLLEQINLMMYAKKVVCSLGTLSHLLAYASEDTEAVFLIRSPKVPVLAQFIISALKNQKTTFVEATRNLLPSSQGLGVSLFYPTQCFVDYLKVSELSCPQTDEICLEMEDGIIAEYIKRYAINYREPGKYSAIKDFTALDFVSSLNQALFNRQIDERYYQVACTSDNSEKLELMNRQNIELSNTIERICRENKELRMNYELIINSRSWRLTGWLRAIKRVLKP